MNALQLLESLQHRIAASDLGRQWIDDPLMEQDVWSVRTLGYPEEESRIRGVQNIYFKEFSLPWLKFLAKITIKASIREKCCLGAISSRVLYLRQLDKFLVSKGYSSPELLTDNLLREFTSQRVTSERQKTIIYVIKLWSEERWLELTYTPFKCRIPTPKVEIIPEEILHQIYNKLDLFPVPLERLFRLQIALGCRIGEIIRMPRQCLKQEGDIWFILRWIEKLKKWQFFQIHSSVADLVKAQQKFLDSQPLINFDKLFSAISVSRVDGAKIGKRFNVEPIGKPKVLSNETIANWLKDFSEIADLKDRHGHQFYITSHQFRRTKASIMAYCEVEDEYIAAVLGHCSLDMLPHYRKRSLDALEKKAKEKGSVNMYGQVTTFKPRKLKYENHEKLAGIMESTTSKVTTQLGNCLRPEMLGDCQYRYACLECVHHRVTLADRTILEVDLAQLENDLKQAEAGGYERKSHGINRLIELITNRLQGLKELEITIQGDESNANS